MHTVVKKVVGVFVRFRRRFSTGHHETTHMMIQHLLETDVTGMKTLDMGWNSNFGDFS
jgi:ribosomal protein L11 methyltransferase